jgi:hypothetical protein
VKPEYHATKTANAAAPRKTQRWCFIENNLKKIISGIKMYRDNKMSLRIINNYRENRVIKVAEKNKNSER